MNNLQEFSHLNHYQFGYNDVPFSIRNSSSDKYFASIGQISRHPNSWRDECISAAKLVYDSTDLPIEVLFSGGLDSNVVLESFRCAKIPVSAVIIRMKGGHNKHDICWATDYCDYHGIKKSILDIDVVSFFENNLFLYADACQSISPQFLLPLWAIDQIDGFPIMGMGELFLQRKINTNHIFDSENEKYRVFSRFLINRNRSGLMDFFKYTPELIASLLIDEKTQWWVKNAKKIRHLSTVRYKYELYSKHFKLPKRPVYNGFEYLKEYDKKYRSALEEKYGHCQEVIEFNYDDRVQNLTIINKE